MQNFFNTPQRINKLRTTAMSWLGTPFRGNCAVKGKHGGVSCQTLAGEIYREAGLLDKSFSIPQGSMSWSSTHKKSLIEDYLATQAMHFTVVSPPIQAGDLVGFKLGGCVHHLGVALDANTFIHCLDRHGTRVSALRDPTFGSRIAKIWRPITQIKVV